MNSLPGLHLPLAACALACAVASPVLAYSDLSRFEDPAYAPCPVDNPECDQGGGGGRFFTGSPADGYTCIVCHRGGKPLQIVVNSLPARYRPGETYDVLVGWSEGAEHVSAALELTDGDGRGAGEVTLPLGAVLKEEDQCEPYVFGFPAAMLYPQRVPSPEGRQIVGLADCGAREIAFQWKAPPMDVGPVWFSGAIVRSDNMSDIENDGVTEFRRPIPSEGTTVVQTTKGGCSVAPGAHPGPRRLLAFVFAALLARLGSRWRRGAR